MIIPIAPQSKPRMTKSDKWKKRKVVTDYWEFKDSVNLHTREGKFTPSGALSFVFNIPVPKSTSKKKKLELIGNPHQNRPDIDNLIKAMLDSLFLEDSHIWKIEAQKIWSDEGSIVIDNL